MVSPHPSPQKCGKDRPQPLTFVKKGAAGQNNPPGSIAGGRQSLRVGAWQPPGGARLACTAGGPYLSGGPIHCPMHLSHRFPALFAGLPGEESAKLEAVLQRSTHPAGHRLLEAGHVCRYLYLLESGLVRCHSPAGRTYWYEFEGHFFTSLRSFYEQRPARECLTLTEDAVLYRITHRDFTGLLGSGLPWARWGLQFYQRELVRIDGYYQQLLAKDATTRYEELIAARPDVLQRIPLQHIASYLGITGVSLSRIRAGKQKKRI
jgi:CRP-like cAMP-binding protein